MKRTLLTTILAVFTSVQAVAATTATLPPRKLTMGNDPAKTAQYDLTAELKKQNLTGRADTGRLVKVEIRGKAKFTGATIGLLVGGVAVSSATFEDDTEKTISLVTDDAVTSPPWALSVRGDLEILSLKVTLDAAGSTPVIEPQEPATPPPAPAPAPAPQQPRPAPTPSATPTPRPQRPQQPPQRDDQDVPSRPTRPAPAPRPQQPTVSDLTPGQVVIGVSESTSRHELVTIVRKNSNGTYRISFQGVEYDGWYRSQFALTRGCQGDFCVGDDVRWTKSRAHDLKVAGILPDPAQVVLQSKEKGQYLVAKVRDLRKAAHTVDIDTPDRPTRWNGGETVYYIDDANQAHLAHIVRRRAGTVTIRLADDERTLEVDPRSRKIARTHGCADNVCVNEVAVTFDRQGRRHEVTVIAIQSSRHVVVRLTGVGLMIGNWPVSALRPSWNSDRQMHYERRHMGPLPGGWPHSMPPGRW